MLNAFHRVAQIGVWFGGLAMLLTAFLVSAEVLLRSFFSIGLSAASEISSYVLAVSAAWGFSFALLHRSHVRVDAAIRLLPRQVVAWVDVIALGALTWYALMLVVHGWEVFAQSWQRNARAMTPLLTPLWVPQGLWWAGLCVFLATCLLVLILALVAVIRGDLRGVNALAGTVSAQEEAESEIREAQALLGAGKG
jgi:TRAP-type C4-dicarboxylate transport system permease small subunit